MLKFHSVGELSCWGCELEIECQIAYPSVTGKVQNLWKSKTYFGQFWYALSTHCPNQNLLRAGGRAESTLLVSFLCKVLRRKDSLPFSREKIDSEVFLWHNFGIFTHTEVRVLIMRLRENDCEEHFLKSLFKRT